MLFSFRETLWSIATESCYLVMLSEEIERQAALMRAWHAALRIVVDA